MAVKESVPPSNTVPVCGVTLTMMEAGGGGGGVPELVPPLRSPVESLPTRGGQLPKEIDTVVAKLAKQLLRRVIAEGAA